MKLYLDQNDEASYRHGSFGRPAQTPGPDQRVCPPLPLFEHSRISHVTACLTLASASCCVCSTPSSQAVFGKAPFLETRATRGTLRRPTQGETRRGRDGAAKAENQSGAGLVQYKYVHSSTRPRCQPPLAGLRHPLSRHLPSPFMCPPKGAAISQGSAITRSRLSLGSIQRAGSRSMGAWRRNIHHVTD